jgi:hypothetical protein
MALPQFPSTDRNLQQLQTAWATQLNPVLRNALVQGQLIETSVVNGVNTINHGLGRKLQGWVVAGMSGGFVQLYDSQASNQMQNKTLVLNSNGSADLKLWVF